MKTVKIILCLIPICIKSQILDNRNCAVFSDSPFFYVDFIKQNKIKKITGKISTKKSLQVIEQRNLVNTYIFDKQGRLDKQYRSFNGSSSKDTTFISYYYTNKDKIKTQRTNDNYGFFSNNFDFDEEDRIISKTYCRDENLSKDKNNFKLGKQHIIVKETYSYNVTDSTISKNTYNTHGKKYKTTTYFFNKHKLKYKEEKKLLINKKKSVIKYTYDDKGNVSQKTIFPNYNKSYNTSTKYKYDDLGNLEYIDEYKNNIHITHKEVIYNKSTLLIKALLIQDIETNYIKIIKYSYEYW